MHNLIPIMFASLKKYFLSKSPKQWVFWLAWALVIKGVMFLFLIQRGNNMGMVGYWGNSAGDALSYLSPIDNLIHHGNYDPDFRMPGYGWFYFIPALFLSKVAAANFLIIEQWICASIALCFFARLSEILFASRRFFYIGFFAFAVSTYANSFDATLLTESFAVSFAIFMLYAFARLLQSGRAKYALYSGIFATILIFLKPVYPPVLAFLLLLIAIKAMKKKLPWKAAVYIILPFVLVDGAWIARNYKVHQRFVPLNQGILYAAAEHSYMKNLFYFMEAWGGRITYWEPRSEIRWFFHRPIGDDTSVPARCPFPSYIYTSAFNADSMKDIQVQTDSVDNFSLPQDVRTAADMRVRARLEVYGNSIKREKPWLYYGYAPVKLVWAFLAHNGRTDPMGPTHTLKDAWVNGVKWFYTINYLFFLVVGMIGIWLQRRQFFKSTLHLAVLSLLAFTILIYPVVFRYTEARYLFPAYPVLVLYVGYAISRLIKPKS